MKSIKFVTTKTSPRFAIFYNKKQKDLPGVAIRIKKVREGWKGNLDSLWRNHLSCRTYTRHTIKDMGGKYVVNAYDAKNKLGCGSRQLLNAKSGTKILSTIKAALIKKYNIIQKPTISKKIEIKRKNNLCITTEIKTQNQIQTIIKTKETIIEGKITKRETVIKEKEKRTLPPLSDEHTNVLATHRQWRQFTSDSPILRRFAQEEHKHYIVKYKEGRGKFFLVE